MFESFLHVLTLVCCFSITYEYTNNVCIELKNENIWEPYFNVLYLPKRYKKMKKSEWLILVAGIVVVGLLRFVISVPNFSPIGAFALTSGFFISNKSRAYVLTLGGVLLSDIVLSLVNQSNMDYMFSISFALVYLAHFITITLGANASKRNERGMIHMLKLSIISSTIFFLLTNFGAWMYDPIYEKTFNGLISSYIAGLSFYKNDILGNPGLNLFVSGIIFTYMFTFLWSFVKTEIRNLFAVQNS